MRRLGRDVQPTDTDPHRSEPGDTEMNRLSEEMARAHMAARLGAAHQQRFGHELVRARRRSRRAERAAQQARLALARAV